MEFEKGINTLVVLAAGLGSRFGGGKQIAEIPGLGKTIMELSIADAALAGIKHVVIVINAAVRDAVEKNILPRIAADIQIDLVEQSITQVPPHFCALADTRVKPWGTGHALLVAKNHVHGKFVVITADDYYGEHAFSDLQKNAKSSSNWHMLGYQVSQTLSQSGGVNRGLCHLDEHGFLISVEEVLEIKQAHEISGIKQSGQKVNIDDDRLSSMTIWQLDETIFEELEFKFCDFLKTNDSVVNGEFYLPNQIQGLIDSNKQQVRVIPARDRWLGVTYANELMYVADQLAKTLNKQRLMSTMTYQEQALALSAEYGLGAENIKIKPIGNGHINTTLLLSAPSKRIVVQKLNTKVFPKPKSLVQNARFIEQHLEDKKRENDYKLEVIKHVATQNHDHLVKLNGDSWRALEFIGGSYSEDVVECQHKAKVAAGAFGAFAKALNDFDAERLATVIPDFHNLAKRIDALESVIAINPVGRVERCADEIAFCRAQLQLLDELAEVCPQLPVRVCHNDTKINNMLFCSETDKAKAVIDLDTCMPGYWMFDFGDMVRTFCSPEEEDSTNLANVVVRQEIFKAIVDGYVEPLKDVISDIERESFWLGAKVMCFMIGVRFLTDHLDGDNYFTVKRDNHNLDRARNQFALYSNLVAKEKELKPLLIK